MMIGWMSGVKIVLLGIVEVNAAVVVVAEVEVGEPLEVDTVEEEH